ncbi:restriction endonuclease subunit S [Anaerotignum sp.]|uniref:restriction endonuclease subunit S n=1 Tax=Anaerotignum sp. TaxID=2039241 RepID=UPI002A7ECFDB|nr:restriction endonuclease subunit S [Anaerotignum sp.]MDY3596889.1 restriction endonuclease subunit S [Anaerotignum sp.]
MKKKQLKEFANLLNGYAFKSKNYVSSGIRIIRIANVKDGYISDEQPCYYPEDTFEDIEKYILKTGDILISLTGNVGRIGIMPSNMLPAALNQRVACIRLKDNSVNKKYLFYYLQRKSFVEDCIKASKGVAQLNLSTKWLEEYSIPIPLLPEQERIVTRIEELFSELDKAVETLKTTKQQLAVYRQAVLKEAFDIQAETVEILSIVKDIRIGPFGTALHKEDYINNGIPVINPQHIKNNSIIPSPKITVTQDKANELSSYQLKANDIIMGRRGEMGRAAAITEKESGWICGTGSIIFRLKDEFDAEFYAKILSSPSVVHYLEEKATGTTMKNLNEKIVRHIPVPKITRQTQVAITNRLENILSVCDSIEQTVDIALQKAEAMRQSILKQAFEGRL